MKLASLPAIASRVATREATERERNFRFRAGTTFHHDSTNPNSDAMAALELAQASPAAFSSPSFRCSVAGRLPSLLHLSFRGASISGRGHRAKATLLGWAHQPGSACRSTRLRASNGGKGSNRDDEGVIRDMESYLADLSLEYESVWDTKPAWCQPWTILLTGAIAIAGSWSLFEAPIVTGILSLVISAWWWIFLYSYPLAYSQMIKERRKKIKDGDEDTFGTKRVNGVSRY